MKPVKNLEVRVGRRRRDVKGLFSATAALALVAAPTMATAAAPAVSVAPATEEVNGENALRGGGFLIALLAAAAIIAGIIIVADDDDSPNSP